MTRGLTTYKLWHYLNRDPLIKTRLGGIYAADLLPKCRGSKSLYIINSDPSSKPGRHWLAVWFEEESVYFFCSLGKNPACYHKNIQTFLKREKKRVLHNRKRLQDAKSALCGHYCLLFALTKSRDMPVTQLLSMFGKNKRKNDTIVKSVIASHFKLED